VTTLEPRRARADRAPTPLPARRRPGRPSGGRLAADRDRLLDAAECVIARDGSGASLEAIAAEAGVTKPTLYARIGGRAALSDALAERLAARMVEHGRAAVVQRRLDRETFRLLFASSLATIGAHRELFLFVTRGSAEDAPHRALFLAGRSAGPLADLLAGRPGAATAVDDDTAATWAYGIVGMLNLVAHRWLEHGGDLEVLARQLADLVWAGVAGDAAGAPRPERATARRRR
jgi:AcrR family transcriptional regulator